MSDAPHTNDTNTIVADRLATIIKQLDTAPAPKPSDFDRLRREYYDLVDEYPDAVEIAMGRYTAVISERTGTDAADIEAIVAHETRWKAMMEDMQRGEPPLTE